MQMWCDHKPAAQIQCRIYPGQRSYAASHRSVCQTTIVKRVSGVRYLPRNNSDQSIRQDEPCRPIFQRMNGVHLFISATSTSPASTLPTIHSIQTQDTGPMLLPPPLHLGAHISSCCTNSTPLCRPVTTKHLILTLIPFVTLTLTLTQTWTLKLHCKVCAGPGGVCLHHRLPHVPLAHGLRLYNCNPNHNPNCH